MSAAKDEAVGLVKKNVGKLVHDDDLRERGKDQIAEGVERRMEPSGNGPRAVGRQSSRDGSVQVRLVRLVRLANSSFNHSRPPVSSRH